MPFDRIIFRGHAFDQMIARYITEVEVRQILEEGVVVEEYPDSIPYPSYLMLGFVDRRPVHVVAADDDAGETTVVITLYEPDPKRWDSSFTKRKKL